MIVFDFFPGTHQCNYEPKTPYVVNLIPSRIPKAKDQISWGGTQPRELTHILILLTLGLPSRTLLNIPTPPPP